MDLTEQTKEKFNKVLDEIGMDETAKEVFLITMEPLVKDHVETLLEQSLTEGEIVAINRECLKRGLEMEHAGLAILKAYEKKTGKSMQHEVDGYMLSILEGIESTRNTLRKVASKVFEYPIQDWGKEFNNYFSLVLEKELNAQNV